MLRGHLGSGVARGAGADSRLVEHRHGAAIPGQEEGRGQAGDAPTDHRHLAAVASVEGGVVGRGAPSSQSERCRPAGMHETLLPASSRGLAIRGGGFQGPISG